MTKALKVFLSFVLLLSLTGFGALIYWLSTSQRGHVLVIQQCEESEL